MKRRHFIQLLAVSAAVPALIEALAKTTRHYLRAVIGRGYPGRLRKFDPEEAKRPGPWNG